MPRDRSGDYVEMKDALDAWGPVAIAQLIDTAKTYNKTITYGRLAKHIQAETGVHHSPVISNWIGEVLNLVIKFCERQGTPHLSSLVVREDGLVGDGYMAVIGARNLILGRLTLEELDDHAAKERFKCYKHFGAEMPADGGRPSLTKKAKVKREYKRAEAKRDAPSALCMSCNVVLPATGVCDNCIS